jgi:uncharacterized damage-inducible protein DinB
MPIADMLLPEFDHEMATTRKLLERVPDDKLEWRPHEKSFPLGHLAQHIATIPLWGSITLEETALDTAVVRDNPPLASRAEILAAFDRQAATVRAQLAGKTDAELMVPWSLKKGTTTLFTMPRVSVWRNFVMNHLVHHRGQLSVYLRMQDVPLPAIYGPSADENPF